MDGGHGDKIKKNALAENGLRQLSETVKKTAQGHIIEGSIIDTMAYPDGDFNVKDNVQEYRAQLQGLGIKEENQLHELVRAQMQKVIDAV